MNIVIKKITSNEALIVRAPVLRKNQSPDLASIKEDNLSETFHFGGFIDNKIVATATIYPENRKHSQNEWRLRGMAVLDDYQLHGIGQLILKSCFNLIQNKNGKTIWCNARIRAINFYKKCGFVICSDKFDIPSIGAHFIMEKKL
tara:strand:+ start:65 stop:499 length:435 start_codon:yes stop_codon:yes gene_type:complete